MIDLAQKRCIPCEGGVMPMKHSEAERMLSHLKEGWKISTDWKRIHRLFIFKDFKGSMLFLNDVAAIAESEGHHPDVYISYNKVRVELWTHAIGGLSENDFIIAAKIDELSS